MEVIEWMLMGAIVVIIALAIFGLIKDSECEQRKGYCERMRKECDHWQQMYKAERAKRRSAAL